MIKLNRNHIFLIGITTCFLFIGINILNYRMNSDFAKGKVITYRTSHNNNAVIAFNLNGKEIRFLSEASINKDDKNEVTVIYNKDNPENAAVYTFVGFYMFYFFFAIIPLMLFTAFIYSWFDKYDFVIVNFRKMKVNTETGLVKKENVK